MKNALLLSLVYSTVVTIFLIAYFGSISASFHKIYRELNFSQRFILIFAVFVIVLVLLGFVLLLLFKVNINTNLGQVGDFVGGLLNPILSFLALIAIVISISLQEKELSSSVDSLRSQEQIFKTQNFESSFFNLLGMYRVRRSEQVLEKNGKDMNAYLYIMDQVHEQRKVYDSRNETARELHVKAKNYMKDEMGYDCAYLAIDQFFFIVNFIESAGFDSAKKSYYISLAYSDFAIAEAGVILNYSLTHRKLRRYLRGVVAVDLRDEFYLSPLLARFYLR